MSKQVKPAAIYVRVSTDGQTTENQRRELEAVAERSGWQVVEVYSDNGVSGAKGRDRRPALDRLLKDATQRRFDVIMSWSVDRLGRSLQHLVALLDDLHALKIDLYLHQQGIDTTTPSGKLLFQVTGAFAEFERAMIQERVKAGLARAKARGKRLGRPPLPQEVRERVLRLRHEGQSVRAIAKTVGLATGTVQKIAARQGGQQSA